MGFIVAFLFFNCMVLSKSISRYHPIYYEKYGALIEPTGVVLSYDKVKYMTIIIEFHKSEKSNEHHNCDTNISKSYENDVLLHQIDALYNSLPSTTHAIMTEYCLQHETLCLNIEANSTIRNKRQIMAMIAGLTGVAGLVSSAYNWIKSNELTNHLDEVAHTLSGLKAVVKNHERRLYHLVDETNNIIRRSSLSFEYFHEFLSKFSCNAMSSFNALEIQNAGIQIQNEIRAIKDMINGIPDNYIIDGNLLKRIIKNNPLFSGTIYKKDSSLFYQVVRTNLIHVDRTNNRFSFLLEIPIIHTTMLSPLYKIYNCGWIEENILHQLLFPKTFYLYSSEGEKSFHAVSLGESHCWKRNEITICDNSKHMMTEEMICLNSLLKGKIFDTCDIKLTKMMKQTSVVKSLSGVLICGDLDVKVVSSAGSMFNYITQDKPNSHYSKFYSYLDFNQIIVGSTIIMSNSDKLPVVYKNDTRFLDTGFDYTWIHHYLSNKPWASLKEIKQLSSDSIWSLYNNQISHSTNNYIWILLSVLVIIIIILSWYIIKTKKDQNKIITFLATQEAKRKLTQSSR
ncbi:ORF4 [Erthesina fullo arlivirus 1]|uniref:ORF4 n=1 Tax=Erthesina fullo arlivirus 1 TaxID=2945982 RepID=UPI002481AA3D|nr:ORF4 [Erthesina fullo arlivirus 1]URA30372.1 ORF4 [Erthesina fullo arlivirus 1]